MVLQEAGALKVPAITTNVPGASEVMVNNQSCVLVEPKDVLSLEKAMLKLLNDKELIARLGESAFERTKELYSRNVMLENQRIAYEELLGE